MRRREFLTVVGSVAVAFPMAARAQKAGKPPTIGVLGPNAPSWSALTASFAERLSQLGWIDGRTIAIEYRWSEGRPERVAEIAVEFVRQKVDAIVTYGGAVATLKQATTSIPIVFAIAGDPLGSSLVASLSRPGGNVTGLSLQEAEIAGKRLELLREVVPWLRRIAVVFDVGYRASVVENSQVQAASRAFGLEAVPYEVRQAEDIELVFDAFKGKVDALYLVQNALMTAKRTTIIALALDARLPMIVDGAEFPRAGALMSYGPSFPALFARAAEYVDKILRGTKPGELPVEQPTKFDLVINLKTAKALGLVIPDKLLALADDVVE